MVRASDEDETGNHMWEETETLETNPRISRPSSEPLTWKCANPAGKRLRQQRNSICFPQKTGCIAKKQSFSQGCPGHGRL